MVTTIKIEQETKDRLLGLDLAEKGKSFNTIVNELISSYKKKNKEYENAMKIHKRQAKEHQEHVKTYNKQVQSYEKRKEEWERLLSWAKSKGFKG